MIIYSKSFPGGPYRFDGPDDALYAKSDSGWIDTELFLFWLKKIFLKHVVSQRPVLLLVDGHKSHINLDVIDLCRQNDVILFCLPPHTTHALQPLDVSVFKSLKDRYAKAVQSLSFTKKNFIVTKRDFSKVLKVPFEQAFSIPNIKAGFTKCGIFPLNPDAIAKSKMTPSSLYGGSCCVTSPSSSAESDSSQYPSSSSTPPPTSTASVISTPVSGAPISSTPVTTRPVSRTPVITPPVSRTPVTTPPVSRTPVTTPPVSRTHVTIPPDSSTPVTTPPVSSTPVTTPPVSSTLVTTPPVSSTPVTTPRVSSTPVTTPCVSSPSGIVNPLVAAGLISPDLMEILATPANDAAMSRKRTKRITGARELTANEYVGMLQEEKRKKDEAEEERQKKKEERERKKKDNEKEKERKRAERELVRAVRGRG